MRSTSLTFKTKAGIFVKDRFTPLLQGIINLILSYVFVQYWGLPGVLFATSISILSIGFWQFPRLCYKFIFHKSLWNYFRRYVIYTLVGGLALFISCYICDLVSLDNALLQTLCNGVISSMTIIGIYYLLFSRSEQYVQLLVYVRNVISYCR